MPAVPSISSVPERPALADWSKDASLVNASSRPTNRALVYVAGIGLIVAPFGEPSSVW